MERMTLEGGETCVWMVCNSCLNLMDVQTARAAKWGMHREWCASLPAEIGAPMKARIERIGQLRATAISSAKRLIHIYCGLYATVVYFNTRRF
jgi:hypothetical protein